MNSKILNSLKLLILICSIVPFSSLTAQNITYSVAEKTANSFYQSHLSVGNISSVNSGKLAYCITYNDDTLLFIFNFTTEGFVIISGDYSLPPVLAYSYEGNFILDPAESGMNDWVDNYAQKCLYARKSISKIIDPGWKMYSEPSVISSGLNTWKKRLVGPLLTTKWNQNNNYNFHCPEFSSGPGGHCYAGCVATAMAQIMKYYNFPEHGTGSHSYYHSYYVSVSANFDTTYYDWASMTNSITGSSKEAISTLIFNCGVSVDMNYMPSGSSAYTEAVPNAISQYFDYQPTAQVVDRSSYDDEDWRELVVDNLDEGHPVYYSGSGSSGGHAFVCDGYQDSLFFHFNWGWSGVNNGYFRLDSLNSGNGDFSSWQQIVLGFVPSNGNYCSSDRIFTNSSKSFNDGSGYSYYWNNSDCAWLIQPPEGNKIILSFSEFSTEVNKDIVCVYDGVSASDPLLGSFSGHNLPPTLTAESGSMYITFVTDSINQDNGWTASYYCNPMGIGEDALDKNTLIYPIPSSDFVSIEIPQKNEQITQIDFYSTDGRLLLSKSSIQNNGYHIDFDISSLKDGIYIIKVFTTNHTIYKKIVKQTMN
jgi:hypothetical protein